MNYDFKKIESKWRKFWKNNQTFKTSNNSKLPKFYILDMFPYPSGAGLHVGHPLGYIATDIFARYKRHKKFNVLDYQLNNMRYKLVSTPKSQQRQTLIDIEINWIKWVFLLTGQEKSGPLNQHIIDGRNGYL